MRVTTGDLVAEPVTVEPFTSCVCVADHDGAPVNRAGLWFTQPD